MGAPVQLIAPASITTAPWTSASFTTVAGSRLYVVVSQTGGASGTVTLAASAIATTLTGIGAWTLIQQSNSGLNNSSSTYVFWTDVTTGSTGTVTVTLATNTPPDARPQVFYMADVSGAAHTGLVGAFVTTATSTQTLAAAPASTDYTLTFATSRNDSDGATAGSGFTLWSNTFKANPSASQSLQHRTGSTSTSAFFAGLGTTHNALLAFNVPQSSGTFGAIPTVTEAATAAVPTGAKAGSAPLGTETSTTTATGSKVAALTRVSEVDTAGALGAARAGSLPRVSEVSAVGAPTGAKVASTPLATETDTARALTSVRAGSLPTATETDTARAITGVASGSGAIPRVGEVGTVFATGAKAANSPRATETDAVAAPAGLKAGSMPQTSTTEFVMPWGAAATIAALVSTETATALSALKSGDLPLAFEIDTAFDFTVPAIAFMPRLRTLKSLTVPNTLVPSSAPNVAEPVTAVDTLTINE